MLGEALAGLRAGAPSIARRSPDGLEESCLLFGREAGRELHGRELRAVQDLVGVGVADSREDPRIGERALERVIPVASRAESACSLAVSTSSPPGSWLTSAGSPRTA